MQGKLIIFSAPSGSGKSTIVNFLLEQGLNLQLSVSATSRPPRGIEQHGKEYYFLTEEEFREKIEKNDFLEWEEVYSGRYYGTIKSIVNNLIDEGKNILFDVDVVGGCNIKKYYGEKALSVFIMPPDIKELAKRLNLRNTDSSEDINKRLEKAEYELTFAPRFDKIIVNDELETAKKEALGIVSEFISQ